ncbi:hypothetical protein AZO1586I_2542, partial [Bathymodiolus thermophilus thioautotrophic gill symbiont]
SLFVGQLCIFLHVSLLFLVGLRVVNIPFGRLIECCTYDVNLRTSRYCYRFFIISKSIYSSISAITWVFIKKIVFLSFKGYDKMLNCKAFRGILSGKNIRIWWRWRELNSRPKTFKQRIYMLSLVYCS